MLPRTVRPLTSGSILVATTTRTRQVPGRSGAASPAVAVADLGERVPNHTGPDPRSVAAGMPPASAYVLRAVPGDTSGSRGSGQSDRPCPLGGSSQVVCTEDARCVCPLAHHVSDAERAVMNDISRQASRLATVLAWIFAVVALAAFVGLVLR